MAWAAGLEPAIVWREFAGLAAIRDAPRTRSRSGRTSSTDWGALGLEP